MQHCYIPFLYVIDFKGALNFGEVQPEITIRQGQIFGPSDSSRLTCVRSSSRPPGFRKSLSPARSPLSREQVRRAD